MLQLSLDIYLPMVPTGDGYDDLYFLVIYSTMSLTSGFTRKTSYDVLVALLTNTYAHDDWKVKQSFGKSFVYSYG